MGIVNNKKKTIFYNLARLATIFSIQKNNPR